jgi:hypothetical protein
VDGVEQGRIRHTGFPGPLANGVPANLYHVFRNVAAAPWQRSGPEWDNDARQLSVVADLNNIGIRA